MSYPLNYKEKQTTIADLQAKLEPQNWQEALVAPALDPERTNTSHLINKIALTLLGGLFTILTFGIGYLLVRTIHTTYTAYQVRVSQTMQQIACTRLYPAVERSPQEQSEIESLSRVKTSSVVVSSSEDPLKRAVIERLKNSSAIPVPTALREGWKTALRGLDLNSRDFDTAFEKILQPLIKLPWPAQLEDTKLLILDELFSLKAVNERIRRDIGSKFGTDTPVTLDDYLDVLDKAYRGRQIALSTYAELPKHIDLGDIGTHFLVLDGMVRPTIYGTGLIAAYYEVKYGLTIHMGTKKSLEKLIQNSSLTEPWGFILFNEGAERNPHVTPLIIFPDTHEILELDSVDESPCKSVPGYKIVSLHNVRQADRQSCRNDALNILCNALWDIKQRKARSTGDFPEVSHRSLPAAWAKTVQKSAGLKDVDMTGFVRTKGAKKSLDEFITSHSEKEGDKLMRRYLHQKGQKYKNKIIELTRNRSNYPEIWAAFQRRSTLFASDGFPTDRPALPSA